jgi:hypothetical protein
MDQALVGGLAVELGDALGSQLLAQRRMHLVLLE